MHPKRIEEASLNAWPALQQVLFDGWILRFSRGYTKRANSVNPLFGSSLDLDQKVDRCEQLYREKDLPPVFRLTPFSSPPQLEQVLERRGYQRIDPTLVLYLNLEGHTPQPAPPAKLRQEGLDDWLALFRSFHETAAEEGQTHKAILQAIPTRRLLASLADSGRVVACGLGVLEDDYLGLFDLITDPHHRNQGYGTQLVSGLLAWGRGFGARHVYLQVTRDNAPARHVYAKLGFEEAYPYWYRVARRDGPHPLPT